MARILVADDEASVREFIVRALRTRGHQVTVAGDGAEALERLEQKSYDLLLTDIVMPVLDGIALALKASKEYPSLRIILMTGFAAELQRVRNLDALFHGLITKPFGLDEICDAVDKALYDPPPPL
ncbi:MAG: response regulator [Proteobacteria bacterium]|nr:response regulator [Pseudomonadota bacterium]